MNLSVVVSLYGRRPGRVNAISSLIELTVDVSFFYLEAIQERRRLFSQLRSLDQHSLWMPASIA